MRSSSTERSSFWPAGSGAWVRLAAVVVLGAGALAAPALDRTGAIYRDTETAGFDVVGPTPSPTATETPTPTPSPTETPTASAEPSPTPTATETPAALTQEPAGPGAGRRSVKP